MSNPIVLVRIKFIALAPTQLWNPNHTRAGRPLTSEGSLAPANPNELLNYTAKGIPYFSPGIPFKACPKLTIKEPKTIAANA